MDNGVYTALVTPFHEDGSINFTLFSKLLLRQKEAGVSGVVIFGATGEGALLSLEEKRDLLRCALDTVEDFPIIASIATPSTREAIHLADVYHEADGLLVLSPSEVKPTQEGLISHFKAIAKNTPLPLIVYNNPARVVVNITPQTMQILKEVKNIVAIKEASDSIQHIMEMRALNPDLKMFCGNDQLTFPILALGGVGVISVASNLYPVEMRELLTLKQHEALFPLFQTLGIATNPIPIKRMMQLFGFDVGAPRPPLTPLIDDLCLIPN